MTRALLVALWFWSSFAVAATTQLPAKLPAFKGHRSAQAKASTPAQNESTPSVVFREDKSKAATETDAQVVQTHTIKESAAADTQTTIVTDGSAPTHELHQALPDSDAFVEIPGRPTASRAIDPVAPQETVSATTQAAEPLPPAPPSIFTHAAEPDMPLPSYFPYSGFDSSSTLTTSAVNDAQAESDVQSEKEIKDFPVGLAKSESESHLDYEKAAEETAYTRSSTPVLKTTFLIPHDERPHRRIFVRTGYLDAHYDRLEGDLRNGATMIGVSVSQVFTKTEVRLGIDVAHGMDQAMNLRNTRMAVFRAEGLYHFWRSGVFRAFGGGAIGIADIDVNSYHRQENSSSDPEIRENAKGTALLGAPAIGARALITRDLSIDASLQYLLIAGGDPVAKLGGFLGELAFGFSF